MNKKTILICDDDEGILEMLELTLTHRGYNIIPEKNSQNVTNIVASRHPDLLLIDLWMPLLSGDQVVKTLRNNPETRLLPVIVISASTEGEKVARAAGATGFLAKPFNLHELLSRISAYLV